MNFSFLWQKMLMLLSVSFVAIAAKAQVKFAMTYDDMLNDRWIEVKDVARGRNYSASRYNYGRFKFFSEDDSISKMLDEKALFVKYDDVIYVRYNEGYDLAFRTKDLDMFYVYPKNHGPMYAEGFGVAELPFGRKRGRVVSSRRICKLLAPYPDLQKQYKKEKVEEKLYPRTILYYLVQAGIIDDIKDTPENEILLMGLQ